jgi:hypothetical protein
MRTLTLVLAAVLLFSLTAAPGEAGCSGKAKKCSAAKSKCPDSGYRAAAWGGSVYYTNEACPGLSEIPKEKLVTGVAATFGRRKARCCR